ncbi:MAG: hypothetical protein U5R49_02635 [Deltaproteobacteria bacterium]|nr:hypothetical protein [Deltaproteobacteria bacterium]
MGKKYGLRTVVISSLIWAISFFPTISWGQSDAPTPGKPFLTLGTAPIPEDNQALAKKRAIDEALSKGVEDYIIRRLSNRDLIHHFERITRDLIPAAKDAVENFNILAEQASDGTYTVLVKFKMNEALIKDALREAGIVVTQGVELRILLMVSEMTGDEIAYWWKDVDAYSALTVTEVALYRAFQDRGVDAINRSSNPPQIEHDAAMTASALSPEAVARWGALFDADVVVYGQCRIINQKEVSLSLNAVDLDRDMSICQEFGVKPLKKDAPASNETHPPVQDLAKDLVARLTACIMQSVSEAQGKIHELKITLDGVRSYKEYITLSTFLEQKVQGVERVVPSRIQQAAVSALVQFQGDKDTFITRVLNHPELPFPLRVNQDKDGFIVLNLQ